MVRSWFYPWVSNPLFAHNHWNFANTSALDSGLFLWNWQMRIIMLFYIILKQPRHSPKPTPWMWFNPYQRSLHEFDLLLVYSQAYDTCKYMFVFHRARGLYLFPQAVVDLVPQLYSIIKQEVNKLLHVGNNFIVGERKVRVLTVRPLHCQTLFGKWGESTC